MTTLQDSFTFGTSTCAFPKRTLHHEGNITHANSSSIIKASTRRSPLPTTTLHHEVKHIALLTTITLHHKGNIACASFTYSTNTTALPKNPLYHEGNLTHASFSFHSIVKENTRTSLLPTTTLHHKGKHKCISKNNYIAS
jgi:hypothetical protein